MDGLTISLIMFVIAQNFYLIREMAKLKQEFKNHLKYLHCEVSECSK